MKKFIAFTVLVFSVLGSVSDAQVTSSTSSNGTMTPQATKAQDAINRVLLEAGMSFREGLLAFIDDNRQMAGEKFNKSVEVFLYSSVNIQRELKLQGCYNVLLETIYRIEFPSTSQLPNIKALSGICTWNIDSGLAEKAEKLVEQSMGKSMISGQLKPDALSEKPTGFKSREFEPSPLDELSKLEIEPSEKSSAVHTIVKPTSVCRLTLDRSPALREIKLGMTVKEVSAIIGQPLKIKTEKDLGAKVDIGRKYFYYNIKIDGKIARLDGVKQLFLSIYNDSVYSIMFVYEPNNISWKDGREFSVILSEKLNLPKTAWFTYGPAAILTCKGFRLTTGVDTDGTPVILLNNEIADRNLKIQEKKAIINEEKRKKELELNKKRVFKP